MRWEINSEQAKNGLRQKVGVGNSFVAGSLQETPMAEPAKKALFDLLKTSHKSRMDFLVSGMKHVKDTEFKTPQGKPNMKKCTVALKSQLLHVCQLGYSFREDIPRDGDYRGALCAIIGGVADYRSKILSCDDWPRNVFVRPWIFDARKQTEAIVA